MSIFQILDVIGLDKIKKHYFKDDLVVLTSAFPRHVKSELWNDRDTLPKYKLWATINPKTKLKKRTYIQYICNDIDYSESQINHLTSMVTPNAEQLILNELNKQMHPKGFSDYFEFPIRVQYETSEMRFDEIVQYKFGIVENEIVLSNYSLEHSQMEFVAGKKGKIWFYASYLNAVINDDKKIKGVTGIESDEMLEKFLEGWNNIDWENKTK